ncbi:beta-1,3-galactosyltransferase 5-like [Drosophila bipectinata]|uniref:beta-1,3-galactosyltransferase 5-like n=1 Tax=Drosophila bipectinata TaxID=42026 RepID=UPI0038B35BF8
MIEQPPCELETKGLIFIHSAPTNFEKRAVIRETWGGVDAIDHSPLRVIFAVGKVENDMVQGSLEKEQTLFGDMLQGNFVDGYFNVTYKHVMGLKWFHTHCQGAKLLIKVDDDIFLNTGELIENLVEPTTKNRTLDAFLQQRESLLFCSLKPHDPVARSYRSKWRVTYEEFPKKYYPNFCPGFTIVYSPDTVKRLYEEVQKSPYFRLDDVYITGIMSSRTNITITDLSPFVIYPSQMNALLEGVVPVSDMQFLVSHHNINPALMRSLWALV